MSKYETFRSFFVLLYSSYKTNLIEIMQDFDQYWILLWRVTLFYFFLFFLFSKTHCTYQYVWKRLRNEGQYLYYPEFSISLFISFECSLTIDHCPVTAARGLPRTLRGEEIPEKNIQKLNISPARPTRHISDCSSTTITWVHSTRLTTKNESET